MREKQLEQLLAGFLDWENKTVEKIDVLSKLILNIQHIDIRKLEKFLEDELK